MTTELIHNNIMVCGVNFYGCEIVHQPGNATRYQLFLNPTSEKGLWCLSWPEMNVSMLVSTASMLDVGYFHEKLNRRKKYELSYVDCSEIIKALRKTEPFKDSPARLCTDDTGHEVEMYFDPA